MANKNDILCFLYPVTTKERSFSPLIRNIIVVDHDLTAGEEDILSTTTTTSRTQFLGRGPLGPADSKVQHHEDDDKQSLQDARSHCLLPPSCSTTCRRKPSRDKIFLLEKNKNMNLLEILDMALDLLDDEDKVDDREDKIMHHDPKCT